MVKIILDNFKLNYNKKGGLVDNLLLIIGILQKRF